MAPRPRAARSRTARPRRPRAPRTSRRRAMTDPGTPWSGACRPATRPAGRRAWHRRAGRRRGRGTGRSRAAPRTPGTARSATARWSVGSTPSARNEPPRCALTENRKSGGVAATQAADLDRGGRAVVGVVQLDGVEATGVVRRGIRRRRSLSDRSAGSSPGRRTRSSRREAARHRRPGSAPTARLALEVAGRAAPVVGASSRRGRRPPGLERDRPGRHRRRRRGNGRRSRGGGSATPPAAGAGPPR